MTALPEAYWPPILMGPGGIRRVGYFFSIREPGAEQMRYRPVAARIVACWRCDWRLFLVEPDDDLVLCPPCRKELTAP